MRRASLVLILIFAAYFRFFGLSWDPGQHFHPDERMMSGVATNVKKAEGYEPHFYAYGQFLPYLYRFTGAVLAPPKALDWGSITRGAIGWLYAILLFGGIAIISTLVYLWGDPRMRASAVAGFATLALAGGVFSVGLSISPWYLVLLFGLTAASVRIAYRSDAGAAAGILIWCLALASVFPPLDGQTFDYEFLKLVGRFWAALSATATVYVCYLMGKRYFRSENIGLLGAAFAATAVLAIQTAHFNVSDSFITFMGTLVAYFALDIAEKGNARSYYLAGAALGLALAAKTSSATLIVFLLVAHGLVLAKMRSGRASKAVLAVVFLGILALGYQATRFAHDLFWQTVWFAWVLTVVFSLAALAGIYWTFRHRDRVASQRRQWLKLGAAFVVAIALFALGSPWSILKLGEFLNSMQHEWRMVTRSELVYTFQFKNQIPYVFPLRNLLDWSLGWALGGCGLAGLLLVRRHLLFYSWPIVYLLFVTSWSTQFVRYYLPVVPFLCVSAAAAIAWTARRNRAGAMAVAGLVLVFSVGRATAYQNVFRQEHPWRQMSRWMYDNIAPGKHIVTEHWDDSLPLDLGPPLHPQRFPQTQFNIYETFGKESDDTPDRRAYYAQTLERADYLSISTKKLWYTLVEATPARRSSGFRRYPLASRYYRALWTGRLGFELVATFTSYPKLFGLEWPTDAYEESASIYEHPHPYLFEKKRHLAREEYAQALSSEDELPPITLAEMVRAAVVVGKPPRDLAEEIK